MGGVNNGVESWKVGGANNGVESARGEFSGCQDVYLLRIASCVDIVKITAWFDHKDWRNCL